MLNRIRLMQRHEDIIPCSWHRRARCSLWLPSDYVEGVLHLSINDEPLIGLRPRDCLLRLYGAIAKIGQGLGHCVKTHLYWKAGQVASFSSMLMSYAQLLIGIRQLVALHYALEINRVNGGLFACSRELNIYVPLLTHWFSYLYSFFIPSTWL